MTETITLRYKLRTYETLPSDKKDRKSKFEIYLNDNLIGVVASPIFDGARLLLKLGFDPDTLLTTQAMSSDVPSWKPQPLRHWAKWTTEEQDDRQVRSKSFREWERVGTTEASRAFPIPTYLNTEDGLKTATQGRSEVSL